MFQTLTLLLLHFFILMNKLIRKNKNKILENMNYIQLTRCTPTAYWSWRKETLFIKHKLLLLIQLLDFCCRLPIIQGPSLSFLVPTLAILSLPQWQCPSQEIIRNMTEAESGELWMSRMREVRIPDDFSCSLLLSYYFFSYFALKMRVCRKKILWFYRQNWK